MFDRTCSQIGFEDERVRRMKVHRTRGPHPMMLYGSLRCPQRPSMSNRKHPKRFETCLPLDFSRTYVAPWHGGMHRTGSFTWSKYKRGIGSVYMNHLEEHVAMVVVKNQAATRGVCFGTARSEIDAGRRLRSHSAASASWTLTTTTTVSSTPRSACTLSCYDDVYPG